VQRDGGPGGAGGAGNPTGGSFTGPAEALEIAGDFAYAYSGQFPASQTQQTVLKFTSGNYLFVGEVFLTAAISNVDLSAIIPVGCLIKLNNAIVINATTGNASKDSPDQVLIPIIIPAYTDVEIIIDSNDGNSAYLSTISMTGRIYRG